MSGEQELDIHAILAIQKRFKTKTDEPVIAATVTDSDLTALATSLNKLMEVLDPPSLSSSSIERVLPDEASGDGEMLVLSDIARLRSTDEPSLGYIRGGATAD
jgi:hypothetical protein